MAFTDEEMKKIRDWATADVTIDWATVNVTISDFEYVAPMPPAETLAHALFETDPRVLAIVDRVCGPHNHVELTRKQVIERAWTQERTIATECLERACTMLDTMQAAKPAHPLVASGIPEGACQRYMRMRD